MRSVHRTLLALAAAVFIAVPAHAQDPTPRLADTSAHLARVISNQAGVITAPAFAPPVAPTAPTPVSPAPTTPAPPPPIDAVLDRDLARLLARTPHAALVIFDEAGNEVYAYQPDAPMMLASVTKLFTVAAAYERRDLGPLASQILKPSNNALAQGLSDELAADPALGPIRTRRAGARAAQDYAASLGVTVTLRDGSGLDRRNRASARSVVQFLRAAEGRPYGDQLQDALPMAGSADGTLARLQGPLTGQVRAKTGTLRDVVTLAGHFRSKKTNNRYSFALLLAGPYGQQGWYLTGWQQQEKLLRQLVLRTR